MADSPVSVPARCSTSYATVPEWVVGVCVGSFLTSFFTLVVAAVILVAATSHDCAEHVEVDVVVCNGVDFDAGPGLICDIFVDEVEGEEMLVEPYGVEPIFCVDGVCYPDFWLGVPYAEPR